jgi:isoleucyl-tRNA synthetase
MRAQDTSVSGDVRDYKTTLSLPQTSLPMRASLAALEPELLETWAETQPYAVLRAARKGAPAFTLHDGPPYANGHLHMGHALNKVLKDMVVRSKRMAGFDVRFRPGWDCHGLPVEWKVEEQYRERGLSKDDVPVLEFRQACRDYAAKWVDVQRAEFKRLGVAADWDNPYLTMDNSTEAAVAREFMAFLMNGTLYQSTKPVMWSPVEQTALAEAEVEYSDRKSPAVWVGYEVESGDLAGAKLVAWTTTPWTLPSSRAVAYGPHLSYALYEVEKQTDVSWAEPGLQLVLATSRADDAARAMRVSLKELRTVSSEELASLRLKHPLSGVDAEWADRLPCLPAEYVTSDAGTGLVHTAPSHGEDDYKLGRRFGLPMTHNLTADGRLRPDMPRFGGLEVVKADGGHGAANDAVMEALLECSTLLARGRVTHSYPHSWRSKAPVLFRNTAQWFVSVDRPVGDSQDRLGTTLRERALAATKEVTWLPQAAENRLASMLKDRPDWVLSRQRAWGVPLTLFTRKDLTPDHPDFLLRDEAVNARVLLAFEQEGADAWYRENAKERFLSPEHDPSLYDQCYDVLDVWFESGASHAFALESDEDVADLYLEGTDQHRGWFQASMLHSVGTKGRAPYKAVLTHGFALDGKGRKMSKSLGNTVAPQDVLAKHGAEVLRLWVALADHTRDFRAGEDALKGASEAFRKVRNTLRFMLGVLKDDQEQANVALADMPLLERWVLHRAAEVGTVVQKAYEDYEFGAAFQAVHDFCAYELSAVYMDVRKDVLYCDGPHSGRRQAALTTMSVCLDVCLSWLAPVLVFTTEDVWRRRHNEAGVHLGQFADLSAYLDPAAARDMSRLLGLRDLANGALDAAMREERLDKRSHACLDLDLGSQPLPSEVTDEDLGDLFLVAGVRRLAGLRDGVSLPHVVGTACATQPEHLFECERCRKAVVVTQTVEAALCQRCENVVTSS